MAAGLCILNPQNLPDMPHNIDQFPMFSLSDMPHMAKRWSDVFTTGAGLTVRTLLLPFAPPPPPKPAWVALAKPLIPWGQSAPHPTSRPEALELKPNPKVPRIIVRARQSSPISPHTLRAVRR